MFYNKILIREIILKIINIKLYEICNINYMKLAHRTPLKAKKIYRWNMFYIN